MGPEWGQISPATISAFILTCLTILLSFILTWRYRSGFMELSHKTSITVGRRLCLTTVYCNGLGQVVLLIREALYMTWIPIPIFMTIRCLQSCIQFTTLTLLTLSAIHRYERIHLILKGTEAKMFLNGMQYCTSLFCIVGSLGWILLDPQIAVYHSFFIHQSWLWSFAVVLSLLWNMVCVIAMDFSMIMTTVRLKMAAHRSNGLSHSMTNDRLESRIVLMKQFKLECLVYYGCLVCMDMAVLLMVIVGHAHPRLNARTVMDMLHMASSLLSVHVYCSIRLLAYFKDGIRKGPRTKMSQYPLLKNHPPKLLTGQDLKKTQDLDDIRSPVDRGRLQDRTIDMTDEPASMMWGHGRAPNEAIAMASISLVEDTVGRPSASHGLGYPHSRPGHSRFSESRFTDSSSDERKPNVLTKLWTRFTLSTPSLLSPHSKSSATTAHPPLTPITHDAEAGPSHYHPEPSIARRAMSPIQEADTPLEHSRHSIPLEELECNDVDSFN